MKKIIIICIFLLPLSLIAQDSKWFPVPATSYVAMMQTVKDPLTIIMMGGEKSIYKLSEKTSLNAWYFGYIDKTMGYCYAGPSVFIEFKDGFASFGCAAGVVSQDYKLIYAFSSFGKYKNIGWFLNTEHNAWPNWHRVWLSYYLNDYVSPMIGSQAFLGFGPGVKLSYKSVSLESMYHFAGGTYLGSENNGGGWSFNLSVNL